jgi:predicted Abi (CAAX) family protease
MKKFILPKTALGKWSIGLAISFIILFVLVSVLGATGQQGGETFFSNLFLAIPGLLAAASDIAAFFTGIISIIFMKERAFLVFASTAIGLLVVAFILGDILFPET